MPRLPLALATLLAAASVQAAPPAAKPAPQPLPKAAPRGEEEHVDAKKLPPFLGLFGPLGLLQKVGFRSAPGRYIEYRMTSSQPGEDDAQSMRVQEVGPAARGQRWIEFVASSPGFEGSGLRILTHGEGMGNVERVIARAPGMPPLEFPLSSMTSDDVAQMPGAALGQGDFKKVGHETLQVPLGRFETDHWVLQAGPEKYEYWVASDEKLPFTGIVKMVSPDSSAVATKVGSDATGMIPVPPRGG